MFIKKKLLCTHLIGSFFLIISVYLKELGIGKFWYLINANSLVGFQNLIENLFYRFSTDKQILNELIFSFLNINIFLLLGTTFIIVATISIILSIS